MERLERTIEVQSELAISSEWCVPSRYGRDHALILAHGAGSDMHSEFLSYLHTTLAERGVLTVRFNFP